MELSQTERSKIFKALLAFLIVTSIYFAAKTISEVKNYRFIGGAPAAAGTMSFAGEGEVFAAPDIATLNVTIREEGKTTGEAVARVTAKEKSVLEFLDKQEIAKKDIKAENYNTYPKYDYGTPCYGAYCRQNVPKIIGYEVSEYMSIKVRDLDKAGEIMGGLGNIGVTEMNGPNFSIENEDELKSEARKMAIDEAKAKAEKLADDLGVHLVRIVNFSEDGGYGGPIYYAKDATLESSAGAAAPSLPQGENKITSNVTITYEIR